MSSKRKHDSNETPVEDALRAKRPRVEQVIPAPASCNLNFITIWEDGDIDVFTFDRNSTPEGEVIYAELMALWRLDNNDNKQDKVSKMRLSEVLFGFVSEKIIWPAARKKKDPPPALPVGLRGIKDWGSWKSLKRPGYKVLKGTTVFFDSWC